MNRLLSKIMFFSLLAFFLTNDALIAQMSMLKFEKFSVRDGLSSNEIKETIQDSDGFIWILTFEGINRYDGFDFKKYLNDSNDSCSISQSVPYSIKEGIDYIWMGSSNGVLNKYDKETGCFKKYKIYNKDKLWNHGIWGLVSEMDSLIWISTERGLVEFDVNTEKFTVFQPTDSNPKEFSVLEDVMYNIYEDINDDNKLLLGTRGGILVFDKNTKSFSRFGVYNARLVINNIYQENDSLMWVAAGKIGIVKINRKTSQYTVFAPKSPAIKFKTTDFVAKKNKDEYWVSFFDYGLSIFNSKDQSFSFFKDIPNGFSDFPVNSCRSIMNSEDGTLWISCRDGLFMSKEKNKLFKNYYIDNTNSLRPVFFFVNDLIEVGDSAYLTTMDQVHYLLFLDKKSGKVIDTLYNDINSDIWYDNLLKDDDGNIWLTSSKGIFLVDIHNRKLTRAELKSDINITEHWLSNIVKDKNGNIFLLDNSLPGLLKIDTKSDSVIVNSDFLKFHQIEAFKNLEIIGNNELLIISDPYPILYDYKKEKFTRIEFANKTISLNHEWLNCGTNNKEDLLFGYGGNGISIFNRNNNSIKTINKETGLLSNGIYQFENDRAGNIWVSTAGGLNVLSKENYEIIASFTENDGLIKNNLGILWTNTFKRLESGDMMIGGHGFFTIFNPDSILSSKENSFNLKFETIIINGKEKVFDKVLYKLSGISLHHQDNSFLIKFADLNFNRKSKERYKYRLVGYENKWNYTTNNFFSFSKVPPGNYRLELSIDKSNKTKALDINIIPAWWQTLWFKVLSVLAILGVLFFLFRKRIAYIKEKEQLKAKYDSDLLKTEMKMLQSQLNSHFLFNSLNSIKNYIIKNKTRLAVSYLNNFASLIRRVLNNSESQFISLKNELETLELYLELERLRFEDKFQYSINVDNNIKPEDTLVPPLLLQPFVENAIWHGLLHKEEKGEVDIYIKKSENRIFYIVTDNGIGRKKSLKLKSKSALNKKNYGLKLSEKRLNTLKAIYDIKIDFEIKDLYDNNNLAKGTQVVISFEEIKNP